MKRIIILFFSLNFALQPLAALAQDTQRSPMGVIGTKSDSAHMLLKDPLISAFESADQIPLALGLPANDPTLDSDPFFLRNQQWVPSAQNAQTDQISVSSTASSTSISVPMAHTSLVVKVPLELITITDEFIYFSVKQNFSQFEEKSSGLATPAEGIFIVARDDLLSNSSQRIAVPFYFLPLPDSGWKEAEGAYLDKSDVMLLVDENANALPVSIADIRDVIKAERFNLLLAQAFTFAAHPDASVDDLRRVIPRSGITAGFGVIFTGINQMDLKESLFAVSSGSVLKDRLTDLSLLLKNILSANNAEAADIKLDPKLAKRLVRVGVVISLAMVASVVLKLTVYRKYFKEKHAQEPVRSLGKRVQDNVSDLGDVFAHTLTTFSQFASVWFASSVEFLGDRYFPTLASANNTMIRKFLNKTVFWVRDTNDRVPVSGRTWLFGSVILGGIDTFFVAVQLYGVVPWIGQRIGSHIPMLQSRVDNAFEIGNPNIESINQNETIRNAASYLTTGASSFSQDLQAQLDEKVKNTIRDQMRREGKNPDAANNATEFKQRSDDLLNTEMQKMGVPSKDDFLFDANLLYENALKLLGYKISPTVFEEGLKSQDFIATNRPGLVISSAKATIAKLIQDSSINPIGINSPYRAEALEFLVKYNQELNLLKSFVRAPVQALFPSRENSSLRFSDRFTEYVNRTRSIRQAFLILTYQGDFENIRSFLPAEWQKYNPEALRLAAKTFSGIFSDRINGMHEEVTYSPPPKDSVAEQQERKALREASEQFLVSKGYNFNTVVGTEEDAAFFKTQYTSALNKSLGLYPDYREKPEVEEIVKGKALQYTSDDLGRPEVQKYLETLGPEERFRFESSLSAANFVKAYKDVVVVSGTFSAISPAQPGRFQWLRQKGPVRNSQVLTRLVRAAESFVAGDQIQPGNAARLERNIPGWYDFKKSNMRTYAGAITRGTATYWFNYAVWGINLPAHLWALSLVTAWTIGAPAQFLTRFFNYQGAKPMGKVGMMGIFALIYTWATFWGEIPQQIFAGDFQHYFNFVVGQHLPESILISSAIIGALQYKEAIKDKMSDIAERGKKIVKTSFDACAEALAAIRY